MYTFYCERGEKFNEIIKVVEGSVVWDHYIFHILPIRVHQCEYPFQINK